MTEQDKCCGKCKFCGVPESDPHKGVCEYFSSMKMPEWFEDNFVEVEYDDGIECDAYMHNVVLTGALQRVRCSY